jgi:hypothetical protein
VALASQGRVHFEIRVEGADPLISERDMVRTDFAADRYAAPACLTQNWNTPGGTEMLAMNRCAGEFREQGIARHDDLFAYRWPAGQAELSGNTALVHHAFAHEIIVLAMVHDREAKHPRVLARAAHDFMALNAMPIIGQRHNSRFVHRSDRGEFFAGNALGERARREHIDDRLSLRLFHDPRHHTRVVHGRRRIRHADDRGKPAGRCTLRPCPNGFLGTLARFAEMDVKIDETRRYQKPGRIQSFCGRWRALHLRWSRNAAVDDKKIRRLIPPVCRVENAAVFDEQ